MKKKNLFCIMILTLSFSVNVNAINLRGFNFDIVLNQEKEYRKIETSQLPADVLKSISAKYSGFAVEEAYMSDDSEYKLILSKGEKRITVIYKASGEFVKEV